jgi:NADH-quinone oxidoreductase subunit L
MTFVIDHSYLIPLLPLIGAIIAGFFGARHLKGRSHWPIWLGVGASAILSLALLFGMAGKAGHVEDGSRRQNVPYEPTNDDLQFADAAPTAEATAPAGPSVDATHAMDGAVGKSKVFFTWIQAGSFKADAGFWFDPLTAVMLAVVCGIGFLICVFAAGYMKGEAGYFRFFAYLGLFIFMMTSLVMGENLIMLYLGWEGVGLCSYLLIGYYYDKPAAREAAKKAFLVNRVGDFGFGIGIILVYHCFGTISYFGDPAAGTQGFMQLAASGFARPGTEHLVQWIPFCLMLGAFGKSAQFPLYVWLPDAMEGPTPVSALIHAATMVTAGVYMIARCSVLFVGNEAALVTIACVGAFTAIFAGSIALRQFDLKKVFAYSTVSQLGFMFVGVAVLAPVAGVFHLVTHAFFKALLFLSSGVVMHAMAGSLDLREMSGLKHVLPKTRWLILIGCLALAGVPPLAGFFSKDEIISFAAHGHGAAGGFLHIVLLATALLTAYYTFRLYFRVFEGSVRVPAGVHVPAGVPLAPPPDAEEKHAAAGLTAHEVAYGHGNAGPAPAPRAHDAEEHAATSGEAHHHHDHEPAVMILPLVVLAAGALLAGLLLGPTHAIGHFLGGSPSFALGHAVAAHRFGDSTDLRAGFGLGEASHGWEPLVIGAFVAASGIALAFFLHLKNRTAGEQLARTLRFIARPIEGKYWVDEIYQRLIVVPLRFIGKVFLFTDAWVVDGLVKTIGALPWVPGMFLKLGVQRGYLQGYAAAMLFGVAAILLVIFL